jgi:hypothetical protein
MYCTTRYWHIYLMFHRVPHNLMLTHISDDSSCTVQLDTGTYFCCFSMYCTTRYWHIYLMFHRVPHNLMLTHISDDSSCTVQLDTGTYFSCFPCIVQLDTGTYLCCFIVYCNTRYWHIFLMFHSLLYN